MSSSPPNKVLAHPTSGRRGEQQRPGLDRAGVAAAHRASLALFPFATIPPGRTSLWFCDCIPAGADVGTAAGLCVPARGHAHGDRCRLLSGPASPTFGGAEGSSLPRPCDSWRPASCPCLWADDRQCRLESDQSNSVFLPCTPFRVSLGDAEPRRESNANLFVFANETGVEVGIFTTLGIMLYRRPI